MPTKGTKGKEAFYEAYKQLNSSLRKLTNGRLKHVKKDESKLMKWIEFLLRPFNPHFASYITCLFYTIYWPKKLQEKILQEKDVGQSGIATLAHEGRHMLDKWMMYTYALPHILALGCFIGFVIVGGWQAALILLMICLILAIGLTGYFLESKYGFIVAVATVALWSVVLVFFMPLSISVWLISGLVLASPIPNFLGLSYLRAIAELRGYRMTLLVDYLVTGRANIPLCLEIQKHLTSGNYYYAMPWPCLAKKMVQKTLKRMRRGDWQNTKDPLTEVLVTILEQNGLLHENCGKIVEMYKKELAEK
jgi:hypothetical protein